MTTWTSGQRITADLLNDDTSTSTNSGLVAAAGFSVSSFLGRKVSGVTVLDIYLNRTGATISAGTTGNIADTLCCTVPAGWRPPDQTVNGHWDNGSAAGGFVMGTDGLTNLRTAGADIATNSNLRLHLAFISDNA